MDHTSSDTLEEERTLCDVPLDTAGPKCGSKVSGLEIRDDLPNSNYFIFNGARAVNTTRRKNVVLFGETGAGKSSVINLIAGDSVAKVSSGVEGCTLASTEYSFTLPGEMTLYIYDTVGLNEPEMGVNTFFGAIEKANKLIMSLHDAGGIDLLLFCIRGGRMTSTIQHNYRLFFEILCEKKVPLALVVTHLENEAVMENWWEKNNKIIHEQYGIQPVAHACVTTAPAEVEYLALKRAESRDTLHKMLEDSFSSPSERYTEDRWMWFSRIAEMLQSFLPTSLFRWNKEPEKKDPEKKDQRKKNQRKKDLQKKDMSDRLQRHCGLSRDDAQRLADMLGRRQLAWNR